MWRLSAADAPSSRPKREPACWCTKSCSVRLATDHATDSVDEQRASRLLLSPLTLVKLVGPIFDLQTTSFNEFTHGLGVCRSHLGLCFGHEKVGVVRCRLEFRATLSAWTVYCAGYKSRFAARPGVCQHMRIL
jgi:hypothetical protein